MATQTVNQSLSIGDIENLDELSKKAAQLEALLLMTCGEGGEVFRRKSDEIQENYLWSCSEIASEVSKLAQKLTGA